MLKAWNNDPQIAINPSFFFKSSTAQIMEKEPTVALEHVKKRTESALGYNTLNQKSIKPWISDWTEQATLAFKWSERTVYTTSGNFTASPMQALEVNRRKEVILCQLAFSFIGSRCFYSGEEFADPPTEDWLQFPACMEWFHHEACGGGRMDWTTACDICLR